MVICFRHSTREYPTVQSIYWFIYVIFSWIWQKRPPVNLGQPVLWPWLPVAHRWGYSHTSNMTLADVGWHWSLFSGRTSPLANCNSSELVIWRVFLCGLHYMFTFIDFINICVMKMMQIYDGKHCNIVHKIQLMNAIKNSCMCKTGFFFLLLDEFWFVMDKSK